MTTTARQGHVTGHQPSSRRSTGAGGTSKRSVAALGGASNRLDPGKRRSGAEDAPTGNGPPAFTAVRPRTTSGIGPQKQAGQRPASSPAATDRRHLTGMCREQEEPGHGRLTGESPAASRFGQIRFPKAKYSPASPGFPGKPALSGIVGRTSLSSVAAASRCREVTS